MTHLPAMRRLFSPTIPRQCVRSGEIYAGVAEWADYMDEHFILQPIVSRHDVRELVDWIIASNLYPTTQRAERRVRKKRHGH